MKLNYHIFTLSASTNVIFLFSYLPNMPIWQTPLNGFCIIMGLVVGLAFCKLLGFVNQEIRYYALGTIVCGLLFLFFGRFVFGDVPDIKTLSPQTMKRLLDTPVICMAMGYLISSSYIFFNSIREDMRPTIPNS